MLKHTNIMTKDFVDNIYSRLQNETVEQKDSEIYIGHRQKQNLDPVLIVLTSKQGLPKLARLAQIYPPPFLLTSSGNNNNNQNWV